jgi:Cu-Zn family superoxide dismutase
MKRMVMAGALLMGCATAGTKEEELVRPATEQAAAPQQGPGAGKPGAKPVEMPVTAEVRVDPAGKGKVTGGGRFAVERGVVTMDLVFANVPPGPHAVALAENCKGGHWNPTNAQHGRFDSSPFHLGDVGNFFANDDGKGSITFTTELWSVGTGLSNDVVDQYVVVREQRDDFASQPDGNSGEVLGCGRIELSQMTQPAVSMTGRLIEKR